MGPSSVWKRCGDADPRASKIFGAKKITSAVFPAREMGGVVLKLYSTKAVARFWGITERQVRNLRDEGVIKEEQPGFYNLQRATQNYIQHIKQDSESEDISYKDEKAKLMRAKREAQEMRLQEERKQLHRSEDIERIMIDMLVAFKTKMRAVPAKLAPVLAEKTDKVEIFSLIKAETDEALRELSSFGETFGDEKQDESGNNSTVQGDF